MNALVFLAATSVWVSVYAAGPAAPPGQASGVAPTESAGKSVEEKKQAELAQLVVAINDRVREQYGERVVVVSRWTQDEPFKSYYVRFKGKLEALGTAQFPRLHGKPIYGQVLAMAQVDPSGSITRIELVQSSNRLLANHSMELLRKLQPLESFSGEIARQADGLFLLIPFNYAHEQ